MHEVLSAARPRPLLLLLVTASLALAATSGCVVADADPASSPPARTSAALAATSDEDPFVDWELSQCLANNPDPGACRRCMSDVCGAFYADDPWEAEFCYAGASPLCEDFPEYEPDPFPVN